MRPTLVEAHVAVKQAEAARRFWSRYRNLRNPGGESAVQWYVRNAEAHFEDVGRASARPWLAADVGVARCPGRDRPNAQPVLASRE